MVSQILLPSARHLENKQSARLTISQSANQPISQAGRQAVSQAAYLMLASVLTDGYGHPTKFETDAKGRKWTLPKHPHKISNHT